MANISRQDFYNIIDTNLINNAEALIEWSFNNNPGANFIDISKLDLNSYTRSQTLSPGNISGSQSIRVVDNDTLTCGQVRRASSGRQTTNSSGQTVIVNQQTRWTSVKPQFRTSMAGIAEAAEANYMANGTEISHTRLTSMLAEIWQAVRQRQNAAPVLNLSVCHDACHVGGFSSGDEI